MVVSAVLPPRTGWGFEFASSSESASQVQDRPGGQFGSPVFGLAGENNSGVSAGATGFAGAATAPSTPTLRSGKRKMNSMDRYDSDEDHNIENDNDNDVYDEYDEHRNFASHSQSRLNGGGPSGTRSVPGSAFRGSNSSVLNSEMDLFSSSFQKRLSTGVSNRLKAHATGSKVSKRARTHTAMGHPLPIGRILESLDKKNLRSIIENLCQTHPYLVGEISNLAPRITVSTAIEHLKNLLSAVYNSLPFKGDQRGDYAYLRVRPAVEEFLSALSDYTSNFLPPTESQPSNTLAFLDSATDLLHQLPVWSNPVNNHHQWVCYDDIASAWIVAIREASKRAGGLGLVHDGWQVKLDKHNEKSDDRLKDAVACIRNELSWLNSNNDEANSTPKQNIFSIYNPHSQTPSMWT
ncbi:Sts1p [Sugiyamaella lignohabitans]|uniref:Tethering factor for nuclear proteasome STS1 n=1 Tax=Sugiyamaella lignohabitans TaxID=796027 RepID=A0A167EEB8_9ASCO|nr:Sts1p [Sugiyamaella lignohabitans]ANB13965.1 Sts1p [Sugiyamaella lignohabitans]